MRLWHTDLIPVLPRKQLGGQWNELGSIYKQDKHILINFVYDYPKEDLYLYSKLVIEERKKRNYKINLDNFHKYFESYLIIHYDKIIFENKMTDKYLAQCYFNLMEKHDCGGMTDEEWQQIDKVARQRVKDWVINNL